MKAVVPESQTSQDLSALAAAAQGSSSQTKVTPAIDPARSAKVAALKAKYTSGQLPVDEKAIAAKLVDSLLDK